jgi:hypothetical protein
VTLVAGTIALPVVVPAFTEDYGYARLTLAILVVLYVGALVVIRFTDAAWRWTFRDDGAWRSTPTDRHREPPLY